MGDEMSDQPLPDGDPEPEITHLKRLSVYVESDGEVPARKLRMHIVGYSDADRDESGGKVIAPGQWPESDIDSELTDSRFVPPTQLDFPIQRRCIIALRLVGKFWKFRSRDAIKTKARHADKRYYSLRTYEIDGQLRGVAFCAKKPYRRRHDGSYVKHGINLYVDFVQDHFELPVTIDPDIENKGRD